MLIEAAKESDGPVLKKELFLKIEKPASKNSQRLKVRLLFYNFLK